MEDIHCGENKMSSVFKCSERIEILGYEIYHLISIGKKESVDLLIEKLGESNIVHYLTDKYKDYLANDFDSINSPYDIEEWEKVLEPFSYMTRGHDVTRKMGIMNEDDGLLMLSFIITEILAEQNYKK